MLAYFFGGTDRVLLQAPAELACKRYAQKDDSICELRFREFIVVIMNPAYPLSICAVLVMAACVVQLPILSD